MSESIGVDIHVRLPCTWMLGPPTGRPQLVEDFAAVVCNAYVDETDNCDGTYTWRVSGEGNYGLNDDDIDNILTRCVRLGIPFVATDDAKYEWDGTVRLFDGDLEVSGTCNADGDIVLTRSDYDIIVKRWDYAPVPNRAGGIATNIRDHFAPFDRDIDDLDISHLPIWPHPDPDDREEPPECR